MPSQGIYCDWLDGAMCLYRSDIFSQIRFDEDYFLYFEETDFHAQILKLGKTIVCASTAYAAQKTNGIPGYWLGRNAYRFFQKIRPGLAFISFAVIVLMHLVRAARKRQFFVQLKQVAKGFSSQGRRVQTSVVNKGSVHAP
jgi:GT2 family glycosyltransferase